MLLVVSLLISATIFGYFALHATDDFRMFVTYIGAMVSLFLLLILAPGVLLRRLQLPRRPVTDHGATDNPDRRGTESKTAMHPLAAFAFIACIIVGGMVALGILIHVVMAFLFWP